MTTLQTGPAEAGIAGMLRRLEEQVGPDDRNLLIAWVSIPNRPDCSAEVIGLMGRYGARLNRVVGLVDAAREAVGLRYDVFQPALCAHLGIPDPNVG